MMIFLGRRLSIRKKQLFYCAVDRLVWDRVSDYVYRYYVEVKERYADGRASKEEMEAANQATAGHEGILSTAFAELDSVPKRETALLRHVIGNPFKPYASPPSWPSTVLLLAASLYEGQDCRLPLSDALEESGHGELAEHFRKEAWHPKGCYAMDLILGKS